MEMIRAENLTKTFEAGRDRVSALCGVDLSVKRGEIFGVIGPSGAGKSTLVRCLNLLERPTSGCVAVGGRVLTELSEGELRAARREIAMIFQGFNLLMQRSVLGNVCFPMEIAGVSKSAARERAMEHLRTVGLEDKARAYPAQLSGGQKQRVAIARALASEPKLILCDEATSALDPATTESILELLRSVNKKYGITMVVITHELRVVEQICSRVAVLDGGRVAEAGPVSEVFSHPRSRAARELLAARGTERRGAGWEAATHGD